MFDTDRLRMDSGRTADGGTNGEVVARSIITTCARWKRLGVATLMVALVASVASVSPAHAAPSDPSAASLGAALSSAIGSDGVFDGDRARAIGVSTEAVDAFATGRSLVGLASRHAAVDRQLVDEVERSTAVVRACAGKNRWDHTGIQLNVYLNSCNTTRLLGVLGASAGVATAIGIITAATGLGGAAAGIIAAGLAVAGGVLTACSSRGRGTVIHNIPPGSVVWCNNQ